LSRFRRIWVCSLLLWLLAAGPALALLPDAENLYAVSLPRTDAAATALIEAESGRVLLEENGDTPLPPASTTKILTALLALDMAKDLDKSYVISPRAAAVPEASVYLKAGESLTLAELLRGALVHSGNDACYAVAEIIAGSEPLFVHWLNMKAAALGAYSVNFTNTNGLPDEEHRVSALDLAELTACALEHDFFRETVDSKYTGLGSGATYRRFQNTNKLLWQDEDIIGVKTGTTDDAGPCLVAAYQPGAACYISVVFDSHDRYGESYSLLRYADEQYIRIVMAEQGQALAYANGRLLYAAERLSVFMERERVEGLKLVWRIDRDGGGGSLTLQDASGNDLGAIELTGER